MKKLAATASFTFCLCGLYATSTASVKYMSFRAAVSAKKISVTAVSTGGYCDKSLKLKFTNKTCDDLKITVEPGLIFSPDDTSMQDLVVMGNEAVTLAPEAAGELDLQTFCGKSYAACPYPNRTYKYVRQADSNLIRTLLYVKNNSVPIGLAQSAVWVFTNGHSLSSVYDYSDPHGSETFLGYVAGLLKVKVPAYFIHYKTENKYGQRPIAPAHTRVFTVMHWQPLDGYRNMHLVVFRENGTVYKTIEADQVIDKYGATVKVEFDPRRDPVGNYVVKLYDDEGKVFGQKAVSIDPNEYGIE